MTTGMAAVTIMMLGDGLLPEVDPGNGCDFGVKWPSENQLAIIVDDVNSTGADSEAWRIEFQQFHNFLMSGDCG